jgi:O-antigen/teichoic acid export membrane protein
MRLVGNVNTVSNQRVSHSHRGPYSHRGFDSHYSPLGAQSSLSHPRPHSHRGPRKPLLRRSLVPARSLTGRAVNAVGWSYASGFTFLLAQVGYTALTARLVPPSEFGGYALALTVIALAGLFGAGGVGNAVMRTHELTGRGARTALTLAAASGLLVSILVIAVAGPIQEWFHVPGTAQALRLLAIQPPMVAVAGVGYGLLRRGQRYQAASLIDLGSSLAGFAVGAATTLSGLGIAGLALGQVTNAAIAMLAALAWARAPIRPVWDRAWARDFISFSVQVTGQNLGHYVINNLPLWSVARQAGGRATGLFSRAYQVLALPTDQFATGLMRALYPLYREVSLSKPRTRRALTEALVITSGACAIVFGTFAVFAQPATLVLLGARWQAASAITPLLCAFAAMNTLYSVLASAAEAMRWMRMIWITQLVFLVAMTASLFVASGRLTLTALAMVVGTTVAHVFMAAWASLSGFLDTGEVLISYSIHTVVGVAVASVPPLVANLAVGQPTVANILVRIAVTAELWFGLWLLRRRIPGLRLGLARLDGIPSLRRSRW